jgi:hypothetical protein
MRPIRRSLDFALAAAFALALFGPAFSWLWSGVPTSRRLPEERLSAPFPKPPSDVIQLAGWARGFEDWFGDALGFRNVLLGLRSRVCVDVFGVSPTGACVLDRDDWVFLTADRSLDAERGTWPLSAFEVERWAATLTARRNFCREQGADYLFVLVPDKPWVYADRLPPELARVGTSRDDQVPARLKDEDVLLDLRAPLAAARSADREHDHAFFPYGSHWTDRGMLAGVDTILEKLRSRPRFSMLAPFTDADLAWWVPTEFEGDNWAPRLYLEGRLSEHERSIGFVRPKVAGQEPVDVAGDSLPPARIVTQIAGSSLPRILVFHDSFGQPMRRFLAHSASRAVCLWGEDFSPRIVAEEKPDLVMELFVDRKLARLPVQNLPELEAGAQARFEASQETAFVLEPARDVRAMSTHDVEVVRTHQGLRVRALQRGVVKLPDAALPEVATSNVAHALARFDIEAEKPGTLLVLYQTPDSGAYLRRNSLSRPITKGHNTVYVDLGIPDIRGPLALGSDIGGAPYTIVGVEVRLER